MARGGHTDATLRQSVLDRLIDDSGSTDAVDWSQAVEVARRSLLRDVEWLLNTRRVYEPAPEAFPEVRRSVYHYGLPDVTSKSGDSPVTRRELARDLEDAIRTFEPRLDAVRVTVPDEAPGEERRLRFHIEADLRLDEVREPIVFDTVLEVSSGEFDVDEG